MSTFISNSWNGIHVHVLPTSKFKITTLAVIFHTDLEKDSATAQAMIPHLLMRGSKGHPTAESIQLALSNLYGASFTGSVSKKGERQLIEFLFKVVNEKYLQDSGELLEKGVALLAEVLFQPLEEAGGFKTDFVEKEKEQHGKRIASLLDDKIHYAAERCLEEMTKGERFSISKLGYKSDLDTFDGQKLFHVYQDLIMAAPMHIYVVGNVKADQVMALLQKYFNYPRQPKKELLTVQTDIVPKNVKEIVERLNVNQGKLNIGCRTKVTHADDQYPALVVYNGILGSFPHSKLFVNVREKASLAYYASSRLESYKGLLYIQSGIQINQYDRALNIIKQQLEEMKNGNISETEMSFTKSGLINSFRTVQDSPEGLIDFHSGGNVSGRSRRFEELISLVESVTKEDVIHIANQVQMDTVYFLRDKEGAAIHA